MEQELTKDFGEKIIEQLEELKQILIKIKMERKNAQECTSTHSCKY
ncbi:MAG: hypothetical protein KC516_02450 [Nanoarchaeota archaeon]|nr:hypothetical protein [Nanoarchaeota archaeon]